MRMEEAGDDTGSVTTVCARLLRQGEMDKLYASRQGIIARRRVKISKNGMYKQDEEIH